VDKDKSNNCKNNIDEILTNQDTYLTALEKEFNLEQESAPVPSATEKRLPKVELTIHLPSNMLVPHIPDLNMENWQQLYKEWPEMNYDLFPRWRSADIPVMVIAGAVGALISNKLFEPFVTSHDNCSNKSFANGGHSGEIIDVVRGKLHRLKYGHDLFNPMEVSWHEYFPPNSPDIALGKTVFAWLRHLFQDTFSSEGLPLPGSSYFREIIQDAGNYEIYKTFLTIKMRDISAAAFVPLAMTLYVYGTERGNKNKFFNYRYTTLTIGALAICISVGLLLQPPSFNHPALLAMIPFVVALFKVNQQVNRLLKERYAIINKNDRILQGQQQMLIEGYRQIDRDHQLLIDSFNQLKEISDRSHFLIEGAIEHCHSILAEQEDFLRDLEEKYLKGEQELWQYRC